jgi:hypothetical protein
LVLVVQAIQMGVIVRFQQLLPLVEEKVPVQLLLQLVALAVVAVVLALAMVLLEPQIKVMQEEIVLVAAVVLVLLVILVQIPQAVLVYHHPLLVRQ